MKIIKQRLGEVQREALRIALDTNAPDENRRKELILSAFGLDINMTAVHLKTSEDLDGWMPFMVKLPDGRTPGRIFIYGGHIYINGEIESEALTICAPDWDIDTIYLARKTLILLIYT